MFLNILVYPSTQFAHSNSVSVWFNCLHSFILTWRCACLGWFPAFLPFQDLPSLRRLVDMFADSKLGAPAQKARATRWLQFAPPSPPGGQFSRCDSRHHMDLPSWSWLSPPLGITSPVLATKKSPVGMIQEFNEL